MTITECRDAGLRATTAGPDALLHCVERGPDLFSTSTSAGRILVELSAVTRTAVRAVGEDAGTCLAAGPGVVVVRDLASAVRLLTRAAAGPVDADRPA
jgi:hypothetical protein